MQFDIEKFKAGWRKLSIGCHNIQEYDELCHIVRDQLSPDGLKLARNRDTIERMLLDEPIWTWLAYYGSSGYGLDACKLSDGEPGENDVWFEELSHYTQCNVDANSLSLFL